MRKRTVALPVLMACLAAGAGAGGCASTGLSTREVRGQDYATYAFSMSEAVDPARSAASSATTSDASGRNTSATMSEAVDSNTATTMSKREPVKTPARIAVGQLG